MGMDESIENPLRLKIQHGGMKEKECYYSVINRR